MRSIAGGDGLAAEQARLTYRMGLRLLEDLSEALGLSADPGSRPRLTEADVPALFAALDASPIPGTIGPRETTQLLRLVRRYEIRLVPLSEFLVIPLPDWLPTSLPEPDGEIDG